MKNKRLLVEGQIFDLIYLYQFIKRLVTPFNKTEAFKLGIIDKNGNVLRKRSELTTSDEKNAYTLYDTLIFNLKKLLGKIPGGKSVLGSFVAGLLLLKEEKNVEFQLLQEDDSTILEHQYKILMEEVMKGEEYSEHIRAVRHQLNEDKRLEQEEMTTADVPTTQEPIASPDAVRRYKKKRFNSKERLDKTGPRAQAGTCMREEEDPRIERHGDFVVFRVDTDTYQKAKRGKMRFERYAKYVGAHDLGEQIREYGRKNPKMPVILKDEKSGQLCFLRYGSMAAEQIKNYYTR